MTYLLYTIVGLVVVVLQTTLSMHFAILGGMYDLFLLFLVYLGFYRSAREGFPFVFLFGLCMDALSGGPFGLYLTSYFWLYISLLGLTLVMRVSNNMILPLVVVGCVLFQNIIFLGTMILFDPEVTSPGLFVAEYPDAIAVVRNHRSGSDTSISPLAQDLGKVVKDL